MAQSIKFGNNTYLDASSIAGIKDTLTSGDLNDYYGTHKSGIYYLGATQTAFSNAPAGWAALIVCSVGDVSLQLVYKNSGIWIRDKSGSPATWQAWRKVNAIKGDENWMYGGSINEVSVPSGTAVAVSSITVPAGVYSIDGYIQYPTNSNGTYRNAAIRSGDASGSVVASTQIPPCSSATTRCSISTSVSFSTDNNTITLTAEHNAGSAVTIPYGRFTAVRIA